MIGCILPSFIHLVYFICVQSLVYSRGVNTISEFISLIFQSIDQFWISIYWIVTHSAYRLHRIPEFTFTRLKDTALLPQRMSIQTTGFINFSPARSKNAIYENGNCHKCRLVAVNQAFPSVHSAYHTLWHTHISFVIHKLDNFMDSAR